MKKKKKKKIVTSFESGVAYFKMEANANGHTDQMSHQAWLHYGWVSMRGEYFRLDSYLANMISTLLEIESAAAEGIPMETKVALLFGRLSLAAAPTQVDVGFLDGLRTTCLRGVQCYESVLERDRSMSPSVCLASYALAHQALKTSLLAMVLRFSLVGLAGRWPDKVVIPCLT